MLEVLDTLRLVSGITYAAFGAMFLAILLGNVDESKSNFLVQHKSVFGLTSCVLCIIFNSISAIYNNKLNIIHNGYAKQNAEVYKTTFKYTEYFPVTIYVVVAVVFSIFLLYLFFRTIYQRKNSES